MERVSIVGCSGAGKTTLARELGRRLALPCLELDGVFHQAGWRPLDRTAFHARVKEHIAQPRWVVDGNYTSQGVAQLVWRRADTIVWIDLPRRVVMAQIVARSIGRVLTGEELWNGNRESLRNLLDRRPENNVIFWAWTRYHEVNRRYAACIHDGTWSEREVFRLRTRGEIAVFIAEHTPRRA